MPPMWNLATTVLLSAAPLPQGGPENIKLPPAPVRQEVQEPKSSSIDDFRKALLRLRRRLRLSQNEETTRVLRIGQDFEDVSMKCLMLLRRVDIDEAYGALQVLRRFGPTEPEEKRKKIAEDLEFLLLTQKFGVITDTAVATLRDVARGEAGDYLMRLLTSQRSIVRRHARDALIPLIRAEHVGRLLDLSEIGDRGVQRACLRLLGHAPLTPDISERLMRGLGQEPELAIVAAEALAEQGTPIVSDLGTILTRPAIGRSFGYASYALAKIERDDVRRPLFEEAMLAPMLSELDVPDSFQRSAVALGLASMAWRSDDLDGERYRDRDVIGALLDVVAPDAYVDHLASLQPIARARLVGLVGQDFGSNRVQWRSWWNGVKELPRFVAARRAIAVDESQAGSVRIEFRGAAGRVFVRGPKSAEPDLDDGGLAFVVDEERMYALIEELRALGFMSNRRVAETPDVPDGRVLILDIAGVEARTEPGIATEQIERLGSKVLEVADAEFWQTFRDPEREPDAAAFWRSETRWRGQHTPQEWDGRIVARLLGSLGRLEGGSRELAIGRLQSIENYREYVTVEQATTLLDIAKAAREWDDATLRLVGLALEAEGDTVWRQAVELAAERDAATAGRVRALPTLFKLLGLERVRQLVSDGDGRIRRVAIQELAQARDLQIIPTLLEIAQNQNDNRVIRETAIFALGEMRVAKARELLMSMIENSAEAGLDSRGRRTTLRALGGIGGPGVVRVLKGAFLSTDALDQRAAVQGLGKMREPLAAQELARIVKLRGEDEIGSIAADQLRLHGDLLATPALLGYLGDPSPDVRRRAALLLGQFQDPNAIEELSKMLDDPKTSLRASQYLYATTGIDIVTARNRFEALRSWRLTHRSDDQGRWLLEALERGSVPHDLTSPMLVPGAGIAAVPELVRLGRSLENPFLRALVGRLLRRTTGEDYGNLDPLIVDDTRRFAVLDRYRLLVERRSSAGK